MKRVDRCWYIRFEDVWIKAGNWKNACELMDYIGRL